MPFSYDESQWPLLIISASGDSSDEDLDQYLGTLTRVLKRHEPHLVIVDATGGRSLKSTHRKRVADWNKEHATELAQYRMGLVLVTPNVALRGFITAIYWLFSPPFPYKTVDTISQAHHWALQEMAKHGRAPLAG